MSRKIVGTLLSEKASIHDSDTNIHLRYIMCIYREDQKILSVYDYALYASVCSPHPHGENIFFLWIYFFLHEVARGALVQNAFLYWVSDIFPSKSWQLSLPVT